MKTIKHSYEYFLVQILFAQSVCQIEKIDLEKALINYTDLYGSFTEKKWGENEKNGIYCKLWIDLMNQFVKKEDPYQMAKHLYDIYLKQSYSQIEIIREKQFMKDEEDARFGCFTINYGQWNKNRFQIKLHFTPLRQGLFETEEYKKVGDLSTVFFEDRKNEFKKLVNYIFTNAEKYEGAKFLISSTWLQNIPNYQKLFPPKYAFEKNRKKLTDSFLGLWGQFERWDRSANAVSVDNFLNNLAKAKSKKEAINSFPYPVYEIKVPLIELFELYLGKN